MSKTNVIILNTSLVTSTLPFDHVSSLVNFIGRFMDEHNTWNLSCELVLVHRNNQVVRMRFERLGEIVGFIQGIQVAGWLLTDEGSTPNLNCLEWGVSDDVDKVFDSRDDGEDYKGNILDDINACYDKTS